MVWARFWGNGYSHGGNESITWHNVFEGQFGKRSITIKIPFNSEIPQQLVLFFSTNIPTHVHNNMWLRIFIAVFLGKEVKK